MEPTEARPASAGATPDGSTGHGVVKRAGTLMLLVAVGAFGPAARAAAPDGGRPARINLDLSKSEAADIAPEPTPAGATLRPPRSSLAEPAPYVLEPTSGGGYLYRGQTFDARIASDGSVTFTNKRAPVAPAGSPALPGRGPFASREPARVGGRPGLRFDLTDEYVHKLHKDPAREAKASFLAGTFDVRMKLAMEARTELRRAAVANLPTQLDELWRDPQLTPSERERLLRATWDGLAADTPNGAAGRAIVRDFARRHLSAKKAAAYR
jgi:hypothetical protein